MGEPDDAAVVERCLGGDHSAYEVIVQRYQRALFNVALRMLGNYEDARDATQTTFLKAYQHLDTFDPAQRFFSWIYRILKNECLNVLRARRPSEPVSMAMPAGDAADPVEEQERHRMIQAALLGLAVEYREVVVMRHFTELSYDEIGAALGIPMKTVKSRLYTARQQLGEMLAGWQTTR
jgi:RNA polymerase sigma-70 factor (ECF subfamily)